MSQLLLLVIALSVDALMASVAYGASKIRIPLASKIALSGISSFSLFLAIKIGNGIGGLLPLGFARGFSFSVLFLLGMSRFLEGMLKESLKKHSASESPILFEFLDFHFIVEVYTDNTKADKDHSKSLSVQEALTLGLILSLDGIAAGIGSGLLVKGTALVLILSFLITLFAIKIGSLLGKKIKEKWNLKGNWISGVLLMLIALLRLRM